MELDPLEFKMFFFMGGRGYVSLVLPRASILTTYRKDPPYETSCDACISLFSEVAPEMKMK